MRNVFKCIIDEFKDTILPIIDTLPEEKINRDRHLLAEVLYCLSKEMGLIGKNSIDEEAFLWLFENNNQFYEGLINKFCLLSINGLLTVFEVYYKHQEELDKEINAIEKNRKSLEKYSETLPKDLKLRIITFGISVLATCFLKTA